MITFVTAFYKLDERTYCTSSDYLRLFKPLADSGVNIHLFIQPKLYDIYMKEIGVRKNIHITQLEFEELPVYQQLKDVELNLPEYRNIEKDTRDFMILMNSKVEFVKRGIDENLFNSTHFAWIDFGIHKFFKSISKVSKLKIQNNELYMPGCWDINHPIDFNKIHWRFSGSFFIGHRDLILKFWNVYNDYYITITEMFGLLTWETNIWAYFEKQGLLSCNWYYGNHDDSIIHV